jgi:hypothetical protein
MPLFIAMTLYTDFIHTRFQILEQCNRI